MPTIDEIVERKAKIDAACRKAGRDPIPFTVMTTCVIGADEADYDRRAAAFKDWSGDAPNTTTGVTGTVEQAKARLQEYADVGVSGVYLQHLLHRDLEMVELIGGLRG
jgi:alkanesulfonate monooxygenase SsuD/methylene tetrahydromethanopterin reductase-like flavin-dependent oxidoreductase (luciferase family)